MSKLFQDPIYSRASRAVISGYKTTNATHVITSCQIQSQRAPQTMDDRLLSPLQFESQLLFLCERRSCWRYWEQKIRSFGCGSGWGAAVSYLPEVQVRSSPRPRGL